MRKHRTESRRESSRNRAASHRTPVPAAEPVEPERLATKVAKIFEMPESALGDAPTVEISGNSEAVVDGCKGVLEYSTTVVRLNTGRMIVRFTGRGLQLKCMTAQTAIITGYIQTVEYSS